MTAEPDFYDNELRRHNAHLRSAADVQRGDRVLDVGCGAGQDHASGRAAEQSEGARWASTCPHRCSNGPVSSAPTRELRNVSTSRATPRPTRSRSALRPVHQPVRDDVLRRPRRRVRQHRPRAPPGGAPGAPGLAAPRPQRVGHRDRPLTGPGTTTHAARRQDRTRSHSATPSSPGADHHRGRLHRGRLHRGPRAGLLRPGHRDRARRRALASGRSRAGSPTWTPRRPLERTRQLRTILTEHDTGEGVEFDSRAWIVTAVRPPPGESPSCGAPQPPPPGVSIRRTSPGGIRMVHLSGRRSARASSPPGSSQFSPTAPGPPPARPHGWRHPALGDERHRHVLEHLQVALDALAARRRARRRRSPAAAGSAAPASGTPARAPRSACSACWSWRCGRRSCRRRPGRAPCPPATVS